MKEYSSLPEQEKRALVQKAMDTGYQYENRYGNCAQCTLASLGDVFPDLGIDDRLIKSAYALGGGLARTTKGTCGALSGAAIAISQLLGRERQNMEEEPLACMEVTEKVYDLFMEKYGGLRCSDVQTALFGRCYEFLKENETEEYFAAGGHTKCGQAVAAAAGAVAELIVNGELK